MMKADEFAAKCRNVATQIPTVYLKGAFGAPLTEAYLKRMQALYPLWYHEARMSMLRPYLDRGIFGFDCVCFLKGILWGWDADVTAPYGGARYAKNGVPDLTVEQMKEHCTDLSNDFDTIEPGEAVFQPGHVGVYLGDGLCAEATPAFGGGALGMGGVILSACNRAIDGYPTRRWQCHGKLAWIEYPESPAAEELPARSSEVTLVLPALSRGCRCEAVRALQGLLNLRLGQALSLPLEADASFGPATEQAVKLWQAKCDLPADGRAEEKLWQTLMEGGAK